jgi:hypothetical protein
VNHLTRMKPGFVCVAGVRPPEGPHVRPVLAGQRLRAVLLEQNGGPFDIGNLVDLGPCQSQPNAPEVEDHIFDPNRANIVRALQPEAFWEQLEGVSEDTLTGIFGESLHEQGSGAAVDLGVGTASLGCLRPSTLVLYVNGWGKLRASVSDGAWTLDLSVTDLRLYESDNQTVHERQVRNLQRRIESGVPVIVSVGLARAFRASGDTQSRHWLQVNNIHLEDNPIWTMG